MKTKSLLLAMALTSMALTSCNNDDEPNEVARVVYNFGLNAVDYTAEGYWTEVYNTGYGNMFWHPDLQATHKATADEYDGVVYKAWKGFCPSKSTDNADYTGGDWIAHQWASITGKGATGTPGYMLACWDVTESTTTMPKEVSVGIGTASNTTFNPQSAYITNSSYGYYAMLKGTPFNHAFTADDWCKVTIIGLYGYDETGRIDVYLAKDGKILDQWQKVDLTPLGECNVVYFQMSSSDSGQWGMNNPAYFCLDELDISYRE